MATQPPAEPPLDEIAEEILLRLPPDEPASLLRASLVCQPWRRLIAHPNFLRRLHALHRRAPLLGFFHDLPDRTIPRFINATASAAFPLPSPVPAGRPWEFLDARHGRALLVARGQCTWDLLVWEPATGLRRSLRAPAAFADVLYFNAAVACAADGCDHRGGGGCLGGPFRVVFVSTAAAEPLTTARVYSSETREWGDPASVEDVPVRRRKPGVLVDGSSLYFLCGAANDRALGCDLNGRGIAVVDLPEELADYRARVTLVPAAGGGLGVAAVDDESRLCLWSRDVNGADGDAGWVRSRAVDLGKLFPDVALAAAEMIRNALTIAPLALTTIGTSRIGHVIGFAEEANAIFLSTINGIFTVDLESERVSKVYETDTYDNFASCNLVPFCGFYIPGNEAAAEEEEDEGTVR